MTSTSAVERRSVQHSRTGSTISDAPSVAIMPSVSKSPSPKMPRWGDHEASETDHGREAVDEDREERAPRQARPAALPRLVVAEHDVQAELGARPEDQRKAEDVAEVEGQPEDEHQTDRPDRSEPERSHREDA